jgi:hypothetical protein
MGLRGALKKQVKKAGSGVKNNVNKAAKGLGKQLPGYGEINVVNGKPQTNRAGNAVRGKVK